MSNVIKKLATVGAVIALVGCSGVGSCHKDMTHHHKRHHRQTMQSNQPQQQVVMMEMVEADVVEIDSVNVLKGAIYTRSSRGGVSDMGWIKFAQTDTGMKMMVDLTDLRPGKDYTVKLYKCGTCDGGDCCTKQCIGAKLPMLSIDQPGRLSQTYDVRGVKWQDLINAKIVLTRDGGYKAAWGRIYPVNN